MDDKLVVVYNKDTKENVVSKEKQTYALNPDVFKIIGPYKEGMDLNKKIEKNKYKHLTAEEKIARNICPTCDSDLVAIDGCKTCYNCGYSACGV